MTNKGIKQVLSSCQKLRVTSGTALKFRGCLTGSKRLEKVREECGESDVCEADVTELSEEGKCNYD